ncbi:hypothetical protein BSKO_03389 [Bryopsis sp. KO-2023]|nr:hypothetical protein BSKO_03389 [Bryopsis sp. KO-2023]
MAVQGMRSVLSVTRDHLSRMAAPRSTGHSLRLRSLEPRFRSVLAGMRTTPIGRSSEDMILAMMAIEVKEGWTTVTSDISSQKEIRLVLTSSPELEYLNHVTTEQSSLVNGFLGNGNFYPAMEVHQEVDSFPYEGRNDVGASFFAGWILLADQFLLLVFFFFSFLSTKPKQM